MSTKVVSFSAARRFFDTIKVASSSLREALHSYRVSYRSMSRNCCKARPSTSNMQRLALLASSLAVLVNIENLSSFASAYDNGLGLTPAMGWNSWNKFFCEGLNQDVVLEVADAMIDRGLHDVGYKYINLDDCWQVSRDHYGYIQEDLEKFPSGIRALADAVHNRSFLFGLYSDAGYLTCAGRPGSLGYEDLDAEMYTNWTVDYLKYDNCYSNPLTAKSRYQRMHDALNATDRPLLFSMCEWGVLNPATWAGDVGNSWRTTGDIRPTWSSWTTILDKNDKWNEYAGPGAFNDPDMLEVGNGELADNLVEARSHFTLWCLVKAPLLLGNDIRDMSDDILKIVSNPEVIAWNQDKLGRQGYKAATYFPDGKRGSAGGGKMLRGSTILDDSKMTNLDIDPERTSLRGEGPLQVWTGQLEADNIAIVLFNRSELKANVTANWTDLGVESTAPFDVRCVWGHMDVGTFTTEFTMEVEPHGVAAFRLSPAQGGDGLAAVE